ncbi:MULTISPECIES: MAPEG family protein [Moorena]|uniref:MAPEG family protein n=1 Tax=Moorena TaxID=1155738 RepID=UPI0002E3A918|nr:MAPEG family protein [Moorena producens]NEP36695.1 MAPEG family protein [Moorena sp. SIO3B2]NEP66099.1 MAPEG family protein [Moorena sp. SIO3A5]NER90924.1 MAPEG family protein [Moorena sp. SIO3A2]
MHLSGSGILLYCIVGATVLIYLPFLVVGYSRFKLGYDQSAPRAMFDQLPPYAQRATWAHQNSFEQNVERSPHLESLMRGGVSETNKLCAASLFWLFLILDICNQLF